MSVRRIFALVVAVVLTGCDGGGVGEQPDPEPVGAFAADTLPELPLTRPGPRTAPGWRIEAGEDAYEGDLSRATRAGDTLVLHLVNADAVNLGILLSGPAGARTVGDAFFAAGRGPSCHLVVSEPAFGVELEEGEEGWLSGAFSGVLGCPDYTPLPVRGAFRVPAPDPRNGGSG